MAAGSATRAGRAARTACSRICARRAGSRPPLSAFAAAIHGWPGWTSSSASVSQSRAAGSSSGSASSKSAWSFSRVCFALKRSAISGCWYGMPSAVCAMTSEPGRRMRGSRRQTQVSPSHGSRMTSMPPRARDRVAHPGLVALRERRLVDRRELPVDDRVDLELGERLSDRREAVLGDGDLEVLVLARLPAAEEIERPAGDHAHGASTPARRRAVSAGCQASQSSRSKSKRSSAHVVRSSGASGRARAGRRSRRR